LPLVLSLRLIHPFPLLRQQQRYQKLKTNASSFTISQFGLSAFKWDAEANRHVARTWNIYLFPRTHRWCDRRFSCQASSIEFLTEHHFDFNKFIYQVVATAAVAHLAYDKLTALSGLSLSLSGGGGGGGGGGGVRPWEDRAWAISIASWRAK